MKKILTLLLCILLTLTIGGISGIATANGVNDWYPGLNKPFFNPPNAIFGPVWTMLYFLMGISLFLVLQSDQHVAKKKALLVFFLQLILNFCWSFLFFRFHLIGWAFLEILCIWLSIVVMIRFFYSISKTAALLQIPYLLWVSFASVLNAAIWWLNLD